MQHYTYNATSSADASLIQTIQEGTNAWTSALAQGDASVILAFYGEDAKAYVPGGGLVAGQPALAAAWQQGVNDGLRHVTVETHEVMQEGALGYETGAYSILDAQGTAAVESGHYLIVYRQEQGAWKIYRHIWTYYFKAAG